MAFLAVNGALHGLDGGLACAGNPGPPFVFFDLAEIASVTTGHTAIVTSAALVFVFG